MLGKRSSRFAAGGAVTALMLLVTSAALGQQNRAALHQQRGATQPVFVGTYPGIDPAEEQLKLGAKAAAKALDVKLSWLTPTTFDVSQQKTITESALSLPNLKGLSVVAADPNSLEG